MSAPSLRHISLHAAQWPEQEPKPSKSTAMELFLTPKFNGHLFSFLDIDALMLMQLVSKSMPHAAIEDVVRERVYKAIPEDDLWKEIGGKNALKGVVIRNFFQPIQPPLSDYPVRCMAGFEQTAPGEFSLYQFQRHEIVANPCLPCLPGRTEARWAILNGTHYIREVEPVELGCCTPRPTGGKFLTLIRCLIDNCCFTRVTNFGWLTTFRENGGDVAVRPIKPALEQEDEEEAFSPKDKNV